MTSNKNYFLVMSVLVLFAAMSRLLPHPDNFSPLVAIALLGGSYFQKPWQAFLVPLAALLISDYFIGFYPDAWAVYGSFILIAALGCFVARDKTPLSKLAFVFGSSVFFYFSTNSAYFFVSDYYPHNVEGYRICMISGIPFFKNAVAGDLLYGTVLLLAAEFSQHRFLTTKSFA